MNFKFDIQFFGGGGSSSEQYRKRDPEDPNLTRLREGLIGAIMPGIQAFDPSSWQKASEDAEWAREHQKKIGDMLPGILDQQQNMIGRIPGMMDRVSPMLDQMAGLADRMPAMLDQLPGSLAKGEGILDEMMGVVRSGEVPQAMTDRMNQSVTKDLQSGMGSMLNSLGSRGVLNSSITSQGTSRLAQQAADAYNRNYLNAYNSVLNGYAQGLQGAQGNAANLIGGIGALGNGIGALGSGAGAIGNAANVYANAAGALGNSANAVTSGMGAFAGLPSQGYENATAAIMPAYNMWKTWQTLYNNSEDYDTVVQQGK